jgi:hypothetical protein
MSNSLPAINSGLAWPALAKAIKKHLLYSKTAKLSFNGRLDHVYRFVSNLDQEVWYNSFTGFQVKTAILGIAHSIATGRLYGALATHIESLDNKELSKLIAKITLIPNLTQGDVSGWLIKNVKP